MPAQSPDSRQSQEKIAQRATTQDQDARRMSGGYDMCCHGFTFKWILLPPPSRAQRASGLWRTSRRKIHGSFVLIFMRFIFTTDGKAMAWPCWLIFYPPFITTQDESFTLSKPWFSGTRRSRVNKTNSICPFASLCQDAKDQPAKIADKPLHLTKDITFPLSSVDNKFDTVYVFTQKVGHR